MGDSMAVLQNEPSRADALSDSLQGINSSRHRRSRGASLLYAGVLLGSLYLFYKLTDDVFDQKYKHERDGDLNYDDHTLRELKEEQSIPLVALARGAAMLGSSNTLGPATLLLTLWLGRRHPRAAVFLAASVGGALGLERLTKRILSRQRPPNSGQLASYKGSSFPSGHATVSTAFVLSLFLIAEKELPRYRCY